MTALLITSGSMFSFFSKDLYDATEAYARQYEGVQLALPDQKILFVIPQIKDAVCLFQLISRVSADALHRLVNLSKSGSRRISSDLALEQSEHPRVACIVFN